MEGHGVVEVEIPDIEPVPGSKYAFIPVFFIFCYPASRQLQTNFLIKLSH